MIAEGALSDRLIHEALGERPRFVLLSDSADLLAVCDTLEQAVERWPPGPPVHVRALVADRFYPLRVREYARLVQLMRRSEGAAQDDPV